jgi:outer membrane protein assembly factor BamB
VSRAAASFLTLAVSLAITWAGEDAPAPAWRQWGGPTGDFRAPAAGIATSWPDGGPRTVWSRELGDGYSAILFESGRLYTMYREGSDEVVICLDARTGQTVWETRYEQAPSRGTQGGYGVGPRSTPLIDGELLFTIGVAGKLLALDKRDGRVLWTRTLWDGDFKGNHLSHGYSSSPVAFGDSVIVSVGDERASLVAFDRASGEIKWSGLSFKNSFSSPRIVEILGQPQLVAFMAGELVGVDPRDGKLLWRYEHANQWGQNITEPEIAGGDTIFLSSPQLGARGLRLKRDGDTIEVEELWTARRVQFYHGSSVRIGEWVYGSSGMTSPAFMMAVNLRTGEIAWRERGIAKANCVEADGKLVILDEDGVLYLASASPEELVVHAKTQLLEGLAWTVPTIVGTTLYVRDNERILALDLG